MSAATRWLIGIGVATVMLVVASVAVARLVDREVEYDVGTPEGTVQAYLRAVAGGDATTAYGFYSTDLQDSCEITNLRDSLRLGTEDFRATLRDVTERADTVEVRVSLMQTYGSGPFDRGESVSEQVFVLTAEGGGWRLVEAPWPSWCPTPVPPARGAATGTEATIWG